MKTILLLAVGSLALLTSSCLTMYPIDPMTNEPSAAMMPEKSAACPKTESCPKTGKPCACSKDCKKACEGQACK